MTDQDAIEAQEPTQEAASEEKTALKRPPIREESPRERAARRAAEVRGNIGDMDEGIDEFYVDQNLIPDGWSYEWKMKSVMGQEQNSHQLALARKGWEPVPTSRHPSYMPSGSTNPIIERKGMVLMERPKELTEEANSIELRKARQQIRTREAQLNSAPEGQFGRDNKGAPLAKINTSYEAMPIPKD